MAKTTINPSNHTKPAPAWYRKTKRIIYLVTSGSVLTGTLSKFGLSDADQMLFIGWMMMGLEVLNIILANGETYAKSES